MSRFISTHAFTLKKTASYYFTHITVAAIVAYAVTGNWLAALTLSLLEPSVQAVVYFFHERAWGRLEQQQTLASDTTATTVSPGPAI